MRGHATRAGALENAQMLKLEILKEGITLKTLALMGG
jgi:hypothetical protein